MYINCWKQFSILSCYLQRCNPKCLESLIVGKGRRNNLSVRNIKGFVRNLLPERSPSTTIVEDFEWKLTELTATIYGKTTDLRWKKPSVWNSNLLFFQGSRLFLPDHTLHFDKCMTSEYLHTSKLKWNEIV